MIDVLANDIDPSGSMWIDSVGSAQNGDVSIDWATNQIQYTPWDMYGATSDSFTYSVMNNDMGYSTATVYVAVESEFADVVFLYVLESAEVGTFVGIVSSDLYGNPTSEFVVSSGSDAGPFLLQQNGEVYVDGTINASPGEVYSFSVTASDGANSQDIIVGIEVLESSDPIPNDTLYDADDYIIVPELTPVGTIVGNIAGHGSDSSTDQYSIESGDESGVFSVDMSGNIKLDLPLNFEIHPGYLLGIQIQNSNTGESITITLAVFIENDPDNDFFPVEPFVGPIQYTDDTIINWISIGLDARNSSRLKPARLADPVRFGDLHPYMQDAIKSGRLITTHGDGEWWWLEPDGSVKSISNGPKLLLDRQVIENQKKANDWIGKLLEEEYKHKNYIYYEEFELGKFFTTLRNVAKTLKYTQGGTGDAQALYNSDNTEIKYNGDIESLPIELVIHETVHAVDHSNNWYLPTYGSNYNAEGLAFAVESMMKSDGLFRFLRIIEDELKKPSPDSGNLRRTWYFAASYLDNLADVQVQYVNTFGFKGSADLTEEQLKDAQAKLLPKFKMGTLANKYSQLADDKGLDYVFSLTNIKSTPTSKDSVDIPAYFH